MATALKYVTLRNGVYQYARRVPQSVRKDPSRYAVEFGSKPLFRRSLRTKIHAEMLVACLPVHLEFERKLAIEAKTTEFIEPVQPKQANLRLKAVTQTDIEELYELYRTLERSSAERTEILADADPQNAELYEAYLYDQELDADAAEKALQSRGKGVGKYESPSEIADWVISNRGWDAPRGSVQYGTIVGAIRSGITKGRDEVALLRRGELIPRLPSALPRLSSIPTLAQATETYLKQKNLPPRTANEVKSSLAIFESVVGNKRLDAISRKDFQTFAEHLASRTIGGKTKGSIQRPASLATLKKRITMLKAVINHAIDTDQFSGSNPASGIKAEAFAARPDRSVMPQKRRFTIDEMNLIFQHPWFTGCASPTQTHKPGKYRLDGCEYWVPVIAAYTGCRASELGGLMISEVHLEGHNPHFIIRDNKWRRTKKGQSRKVPILDALMELGFADYCHRIQKSGAERLFPDWLPPSGKGSERNDDKQWSNGKIIRAFNRTVIPQMLGDRFAADARREATFHGFRGAFKAMLSNSEYKLNRNIIDEISGHEKNGMDAVYIGEIGIEETYPATRACRHKGLVIPSLPSPTTGEN